MQKINYNSLNLVQIPTKIGTEMRFNEPFMCTKFQHDRSMRLQVMVENTKCEKTRRGRKKRRNYFETLLNHFSGLAGMIWYVDLPSSGAFLQQIWLNSGKISQSYIGVKIKFFVFLPMYSQCGATASWAARHTTMRLDMYGYLYL